MQKSKFGFFASLFVLQVLSLVTIWSTYPSLFLTQVSFVLIGILIVYLVSKVDHTVLFSTATFWYLTSIAILVLTYFIGRNVRGSIRWIDFGFFNLQTSELVKPMLAIFYCSYLTMFPPKKISQYLKFIFLSLIPVVLVAKQPDLGSALTILFMPIFLLMVSGHFKQVLVFGALFLFLAVPLESVLLKPYQRTRIETFLNPYKDPQGAGYNVIQATIAVGSGGFFGKGVKLGTQSHLNFLPERHTDFIFASFAEEFGFLGVLFFLFCFYYLFRFFLYVSSRQKDQDSYLLCLSGFSVILFQFIVNVGMNMGLMPVTGITLPLFSYGGSSLLSFAIFLGFLVRQLDLLPPIEI
ncbi:hypothetical protein A2572_01430 [Candidatus Collierbacteria bacterium RIFOXYD1_FULL_40_9]|uniref:Rod shape-determining protein RodA n=1 Tax=Candidatus Collierbacteria bacterium RIFOXYD1_FULL_40_9 TaxID=1817731 RepID=A0A1F5FVT9_9BACT|nr:MAG: hypothetical protein A2572_01430 [Candidatus Collierbacteria bacterium RIFOXYD1_FULL_40_9]